MAGTKEHQKQIALRVDKDVYFALKFFCIKNGIQMQEILETGLKNEMEKRGIK